MKTSVILELYDKTACLPYGMTELLLEREAELMGLLSEHLDKWSDSLLFHSHNCKYHRNHKSECTCGRDELYEKTRKTLDV